jgi:hypothetical protein
MVYIFNDMFWQGRICRCGEPGDNQNVEARISNNTFKL